MDDESYEIRWYDVEKTILLVEVGEGWTWTEAHLALDEVNRSVMAAGREVYVIIHFLTGQVRLPDSGMLANMRYLLTADPSAEQLTIFVSQTGFLQTLLSMATRVFGLTSALEKLRFVVTFDEALAAIEAHRESAVD